MHASQGRNEIEPSAEAAEAAVPNAEAEATDGVTDSTNPTRDAFTEAEAVARAEAEAELEPGTRSAIKRSLVLLAVFLLCLGLLFVLAAATDPYGAGCGGG